MKLVSFFSGCGGLDLGFEQAGFEVIWANEYDPSIHKTYCFNHRETYLCGKDIRKLEVSEIPDCDGFIGGPPCQSWSTGGKMRGLDDSRGRVFLDYIKLIKGKRPKFFLIENVAGIISDHHFVTFHSFISTLSEAGYKVQYSVINTSHYGIPQERLRVIVVGIRNDLNCDFVFPFPNEKQKVSMKSAIGDIMEEPFPCMKGDKVKIELEGLSNNDYYAAPFDGYYFERNRHRDWDEVSYTIVASANVIPLHPSSPKMIRDSKKGWHFIEGEEDKYRRLSVRECARLQSFPDDFVFFYDDIRDGYKMVGNAVPPKLGYQIAVALKEAMEKSRLFHQSHSVLVGYYKSEEHLRSILKNRLYYVRTGFRKGAMQLPAGEKQPDYLLLYHGEVKHLFELKNNEPFVCSADYLRGMGFQPNGDVYLCFEIESGKRKDVPVFLRQGLNYSRNFVPFIMKLEN